MTGSGSDGTEAAVKIARQYFFDQDPNTEREIVISRNQGYHGNTLGASRFALRCFATPFPSVPLGRKSGILGLVFPANF